jgi:hypothetical protein
MARILLAAIAAFLLCAPAANATIIVQRDIDSTTDEVWAYDDSGANGRLLIPDNFEKGQFETYKVSTTATGNDVVFSANTPSYATYGGASSPPGACGRFCYGIYVLSDTAIRRLSPPVDPCDGFPCVIFEDSPEFAAGGGVVFDRFTKLWSACGASWCTQDGDYTLARRPLSGPSEDATVLQTPDDCKPEDPAPHPTTVGLVVFTGCTGTSEGSTVWYVSSIDATGTVTNLYFDDFPIGDPAWNAAGTLIVDAERGMNPGVWISTADGMGAQYVLAVPTDDYVSSPRFMGDKVVFVYKGDVYSIDPALCEDPCSVAQATKLTSTGDVGSVTYTSAAPKAFVKPTTNTGGGGGGGAGGSATTPTPTPTPAPTPTPTPGPVVTVPPLDAGFAFTGKRTLRGLLAGKLGVKLSCDCSVTATLRFGKTVVAKGSGRQAFKLKPSKAAKRKLRRLKKAKLKLLMRSGDRSFSRTTTLRR